MTHPLVTLIAQAEQAEPGSGVTMFFIAGDSFGQVILAILWLMSFTGVAIAIWSWTRARSELQIPRNADSLLLAPARRGDAREARSAAQSLKGVFGRLTRAVTTAPDGEAARHAADEAAAIEWQRLSKPAELIALMGQVAPMVGLFGTVYGMIRAFVALVESGPAGGGDLKLAAGISTALVTTFWGLVVAIPASIIAQILLSSIEQKLSEALAMAQRLSGLLQAGGETDTTTQA
ncbi:MotA/TolQ/ExbB proton channel family protein [Mucisphaera sp.]|uniref:MotA/TolQ/ExbB proton channel family protein n=1 Tax=Mucisphaera sp. TaxID=2913024 RepID=UPI003D0D8BA0